jgi:hypothetical protein
MIPSWLGRVSHDYGDLPLGTINNARWRFLMSLVLQSFIAAINSVIDYLTHRMNVLSQSPYIRHKIGLK